MNVGLPLFDPDEKGILIWRCKRIEIVLRTSNEMNLETGGTVWHAAHRLSEYLIKNPSLVRNKRVLELGCGCGLVGLVAAALGAKSVMMTDIDNQVPIIQENINLNRYLRSLKGRGIQDSFNSCQVTCSSMWFGERVGDIEEDKYDVILGADIGYDVSLQEPIAMTLYSGLVNKKSFALLAEEVRWKDVYSWYVDALTNNDLAYENCELVRKGSAFESTSSIKGSVLRDGVSSKGMGANGTIYNQTDTMDTMGLKTSTAPNRRSFIRFGSYDSAENNNPTSHRSLGASNSLDMIDFEESDEAANSVGTLTKYPCPELTEKNIIQNVQLLESLIEKICVGDGKTDTGEELGKEVDLRVSMCPIKILKASRKKR